jgi:hypothetical protein
MIHRIIVEIETEDDGKVSGLESIVGLIYEELIESSYFIHENAPCTIKDVFYEGGSSATGKH